MTKPFRTAAEQELLSVRALERRVANLERAGAGLPSSFKAATGDLVLTTSAADVPGASIAIVRPGRYLVVAMYDVNVSVAGAGLTVFGTIATVGSATLNAPPALQNMDTVERATKFAFALATFAGAGTVKLTANKNGAGGTATVIFGIGSTALTAIRTGPA